jgi:LAO/AO transport system kinase
MLHSSFFYFFKADLEVSKDLKTIAARIREGDRQAIARAMTLVENDTDDAYEILNTLFSYSGAAYRLGMTGPPGSGKSTLTNQLTKLLRTENFKVGIIAVDPTSPFTGGAILGDRIRMNDLTLDQGVFIRSVASRGSGGGLARQVNELADILDAAGYQIIIFETVGVGQVELDVAAAADTTLVMMIPESGDMIQGLKAGLMEIADIFVLNKSDRPGAERMRTDIEYVLHLREAGSWSPVVIQTIASEAKGIENLWAEIGRHKAYLMSGNRLKLKREERLRKRIERLIREKIEQNFWTDQRKQALRKYLEDENKEVSPYLLAEKMLVKLLKTL